MIYIIIILYILGWLSVAIAQIIDEEMYPLYSMSYKVQLILQGSFFMWWLTPFIFLFGVLSEHIRQKRAEK